MPREVKDGPEARTGPCSSRRLCLGSEGPTLRDGGALSSQSQRTCRDEVAWLGGGKRVDRPGGTGQEPVQQVGPLTAEQLLRAPPGTVPAFAGPMLDCASERPPELLTQ